MLANKKNSGFVKGSLLINGKPRDARFQLLSGYVEQTDSHNPYSTVREAIEFSARLRLPLGMSEEEKVERVEAVIDKLGLRPVQHTQIGTVEMGGVSPEVRKKCTIAVELIMNPSILCTSVCSPLLGSAFLFLSSLWIVLSLLCRVLCLSFCVLLLPLPLQFWMSRVSATFLSALHSVCTHDLTSNALFV